MLHEENPAFAEEEVGGVSAQPQPPAPYTSAPEAAATLSNASAPIHTTPTTDLKHTLADQKKLQQSGSTATVWTPGMQAHSGRQNIDNSFESAFTPALDDATQTAATAGATFGSNLGEPTSTRQESNGGSSVDRTPMGSQDQAYQRGVRRPDVTQSLSPVAAAAVQRDTALDKELRDPEGNLVVVAAARTPSQSSRCGSRLRGPPVADVMNVPANAPSVGSAPTTALMGVLVSEEEHCGVLIPDGMRRPASQDSILFSIRSSSSSSSRSSFSRSSNAGEPVQARDSPVTAASVFPQQPPYESNNSSSGPLPVTSVNGHANGYSDSCNGDATNCSWPHASESLHSSPAAVTLWGVHRDLRRKRIKKVSHYILGSLLGEGAYGVVRDCLDINTDNVNRRFQRCAIKIVNGAYAKADMPALFGNRANNSSSSMKSGADSSSPSPDPAITSASSTLPTRATLKRASGSDYGNGMRYQREEEQKRQESFQREMRNLQRFHCKNIIRALDSFTRYNKEYVVLPIAICSVQQLVRQLMRTRWREAVREWRKQQRKRQRSLAVAGGDSNGKQESQLLSSASHELPAVPTTIDTLDLDDLTFMLDDESGFDDGETEDYCDNEDSDTTTATSISATHTTANSVSNRNNNYDSKMKRHPGASQGLGGADNNDDDGDRHSSGSLSDHDDDVDNYRHNNNNDNSRGVASGLRGYPANHSNSNNINSTLSNCRRGLPRVVSSASNTTTTTTTARTIDSYDNINNNNDMRGGVPRGHQLGGEDETSDLSSCGVNRDNPNSIRVMSATPTTPDGELVLGKHASVRRNGREGRTSTAAAAMTGKIGSAPPPRPVSESRPHIMYPVCSTTLLKGIFYQVISGVNYLHQQNLAHNDIKPSNILLFEDGTVKLGDLGSVSESYNDQGTPLCASPELCRYFYGAATPPSSFSQSTESVGRDAAKPSDMWCCGLLLYYLITGKPGPLPVQLRYFQSLHSKQCRHHNSYHNHGDVSQLMRREVGVAGGQGEAAGRNLVGDSNTGSTASTLPQIVTRYQLYREIASQTTPVDLSGLPDMIPPDLDNDNGNTFASDSEDENNNDNKDPNTAFLPVSPYPKNSVRHLLAGLLELDPQRRLSAEQALHHPWLRMTFRFKQNDRDSGHHPHRGTSKRGRKNFSPNPQGAESSNRSKGSSAAQAISRKAPSRQAMEDAIQRDVARRVTESRHVQRMLMLDRQRHLQFVADCCNMLNLSIPPEIMKVQPAEPYREDLDIPAAAAGNTNSKAGAAVVRSRLGLGAPSAESRSSGPATQQQRNAAAAAVAAAMLSGGRSNPRVQSAQQHMHNQKSNNNNTNVPVTGTVLQSAMMPAVMPPGCVDTELFLPHTEEDYYEQKSGKSEFDVRVLRRKPLLMAQLDEYFHNVVLVQCGYRTGPDPNYQAMRVRAVPIEDELGSGSGRRRNNGGGSGSGRGNTQQPSVVILPGASSNMYRRSPSVGMTQLSPLEGTSALMNNNSNGTDGLNTTGIGSDVDVLVEDVWGAGPRHQPRVHVDENGNVVSAVPHYPTTPVSDMAVVAAGRVVGGGSGNNENGSQPSSNSMNCREDSGATASFSTSANKSPQRSTFSFSAHGASVSPSGGVSNNSRSGNGSPRSLGANQPTVSLTASATNTNNRSNMVDSMGTQEVIGTAVVNTARTGVALSSNHNINSTRRSGTNGGRGNNDNDNSRSPRVASESASEAEQNIAMRESSKCLCGLM